MSFVPSSMKVVSSAFRNGGAIPKKHTGDGENVSPALEWSDPPAGTQGFAVICHDPDAPLIRDGTYGWVHWVLHGLPASKMSLGEGTDEGTPGVHDGGGQGYSGPMPPEGHGKHLYYFWVLALDENLQLQSGLTLWQFLERAEPHVIGMSRLVGTYER